MSKSKQNKKTSKEEQQVPDIEYGFLVVKTKAGDHMVQILKDSDVPEPQSVNDVYNSCTSVCKNIQIQQTAEAISAAMAMAAKVQSQADKGIVVPK